MPSPISMPAKTQPATRPIKPPPMPRKKIGVCPVSGRPLFPAQPAPAAVDPPLPAIPAYDPVHVDGLLSVAECDAAISRGIAQQLQLTLVLLRVPVANARNHHQVVALRERLNEQAGMLSDQISAIRERRSELFMKHVDRSAQQRAQAENDKRNAAWLHGRSARPY